MFEGNRPEPFLIIPYKLIRSKAYSKWMVTKEYAVWAYLLTYVIRSPKMNVGGSLDIYEDYFVQRKLLASRWTLELLADRLDTSKGAVARYVKSLNEKGLLKIEKVIIDYAKINIYIFGTHDGFGNEILFAHTVFKKLAAAEQLKKLEAI